MCPSVLEGFCRHLLPVYHRLSKPRSLNDALPLGPARFSVLQLRVQECSRQAISTVSCVAPIAQQFLNREHKVVRCQGTSRTCVPVKEPCVGNMRVAQILSPCHLLPRTSCLQRVLQASQPHPVSQPGRVCLQLEFLDYRHRPAR